MPFKDKDEDGSDTYHIKFFFFADMPIVLNYSPAAFKGAFKLSLLVFWDSDVFV